MDTRGDFLLPADDERFLHEFGLRWETVKDGAQWLLLHDFSLPQGYNTDTASVAILIVAGYPITPLDMAYFYPALQRADGRPIKATESLQEICGKKWQRWSRHRTAVNPWIPGQDSIESHLLLVQDWLAREFRQ